MTTGSGDRHEGFCTPPRQLRFKQLPSLERHATAEHPSLSGHGRPNAQPTRRARASPEAWQLSNLQRDANKAPRLPVRGPWLAALTLATCKSKWHDQGAFP